MKPNISIAALVCGLIFSVNASAKTIESVSPDGRNKIGYSDKNITVTRDGNALLSIPVDIVISQNGRTIPFGKGINIEVKAFDDGVAYRYVSKLKEIISWNPRRQTSPSQVTTHPTSPLYESSET